MDLDSGSVPIPRCTGWISSDYDSSSAFLEKPFADENNPVPRCCGAPRPPLCFDHTIHLNASATSILLP